MTPQPNKAKRFRPRFSVRTLVILVTLVCAYAACWGPTKRQGVADVVPHLAAVDPGFVPYSSYNSGKTLEVSPQLPLLLRVTRFTTESSVDRYYIWFFGYLAMLPYEREINVEAPMDYERLGLDYDFELSSGTP